MTVSIPAAVLDQYRLFSLYNSPYAAHDHGCAIDLYPETNLAPSPVAGEVLDTRTVRAPPKPYAVEHDHLVLVDTGEHVARMLHVDPSVEPGDVVAIGDPLGEMVRSGFFAPWVDNHVHLGFRDPDADHYRASGSLPVEAAVPVEALPWDGTGTVVERGDTYVVLDAPVHPAPGERFVGVAAGPDGTGGGGVLDGGLPHYDHGGVLPAGEGAVSLVGTTVGTARNRDVTWDDVVVRANGTPIHGLSLYAGRTAFGAKLVCPDWDAAVGEHVEVTVERR